MSYPRETAGSLVAVPGSLAVGGLSGDVAGGDFVAYLNAGIWRLI